MHRDLLALGQPHNSNILNTELVSEYSEAYNAHNGTTCRHMCKLIISLYLHQNTKLEWIQKKIEPK